MARHERPVISVFLIVLGVFASAFGLRWVRAAWRRPIRLDTLASSYLHYDFIELRLRTRDPALRALWRRDGAPRAFVVRDGRPVETVGGRVSTPLAWDDNEAAFTARWPCPWNAPPGEYGLDLEAGPEARARLRPATFLVARRAPKPLPRRFVALNLESVAPLGTIRVRAPDGRVKGWRGMLDWAQFVEADAFWMLAGQTPGKGAGETWVADNLPLIPFVAEECRRRGLKFGVYAMDYLTMSATNRVPGYEYALDLADGKIKTTRAVSLRDPRRPLDVAALLKRFKSLPGVDYLGLDYIRNALGGYELIDDFFAEMPGVRPPAGWEALSPLERMTWFVRKKVMRKDMAFVESWEWWRARRAALAIKTTKRELGDDKPLWAFVLTWDKGWHHGQDPAMFNDAGVDALALMLYEADGAQFSQMLRDWHGYVGGSDAQLIVGDVIDWPLHQRSPKGPGEFGERLMRAAGGIYGDGAPAAGVFYHDIARALDGRLGPYTSRQWLEEARRVTRRFRALPPVVSAPARRRPS